MSDLAVITPVSPLRQIIGWIIAGHAEPDIVDAIAQKWPDTKAKPLIISALKEIARAGTPDRDLVRGFAIEATREIYRKSSEVGDHQTALRALKQLVDLSK